MPQVRETVFDITRLDIWQDITDAEAEEMYRIAQLLDQDKWDF